ncbi:hypothetical protein DPMN_097291 [Dreissena polymorpha]|uniref:Uncharacterized protein n=1 Tax=Dreissena polymorpha TaxID=45954 RepID=A0A9D4LCQ3_DREPO|nr:hypothetical protein DPMN_097291 [Dreissena polymorpha]
MKTGPPPGYHVFQRTQTIFKIRRAITRTNVLTKFHEDWTINGTSKSVKKFLLQFYSHIWKTAPHPGGHTNAIPKFHEDWTINVTSIVLDLNEVIIGTNLWTKFMKIIKTMQNVNNGQRTTDKR